MKTFEQMRKGFLKEVEERRVYLSTEQSHYDMIIQDALHFLENEKCDAIAMIKIAKYIKETQQKRRRVKVELEKLQSVCDSITKGVVRFDKKTYTYRTTTISTIKRIYRKSE